ncbi:hypothetical protein MTQ13_26115 [Streptomyces sp. XM4011]|uniref:hypothetical protein n=1 Tax=Streptomyces sp. XM4011 TaxID=2929780 RepID=UPI001FF74C90|nr:hypothetical protein [Streptomyces sp. XM4011]MCK1817709.1 hypothetical protein [Streptomyces sp. XM4011]
MPQLVTVRRRRSDGRPRRLFVPVLPVLVLLSPLLLLVVLGGLIACLVARVRPLGALAGVARLVWALPGTRFELVQGRTDVRIEVR